MNLRKVISGGQTGADMAGLVIAKEFGIETGGWAPRGWLTSDGPNRKLLEGYGLIESDGDYKRRTWENVRDSNATLRLAISFNTPGEKCTFNAIEKYKKPWLDVNLLEPRPIHEVIEFLVFVQPSILNIAGNTQGTKGQDVFDLTYNYLKEVFKRIVKGD